MSQPREYGVWRSEPWREADSPNTPQTSLWVLPGSDSWDRRPHGINPRAWSCPRGEAGGSPRSSVSAEQTKVESRVLRCLNSCLVSLRLPKVQRGLFWDLVFLSGPFLNAVFVIFCIIECVNYV